MGHFTVGEWADFARHIEAPPATAPMQRHLDEGCQRCLKVVRMWRDLIDFGSKERLYCPPHRALRAVRGYYGLLKPGRGESRVAMMARLVFDSLLEAVPAGIRSSQSSLRQLVYSAGNFLIDLRLERRLGRVYLVGQAQRRAAANPGVVGIDVFVLKGGEMVVKTKSNRFGEFQFDLESESDEGVSVVLKGPESIVIPLPEV